MSDNPTVSVVIPAYNASRWIGETLDSILAQAFRDFEVIVVDDGSTDDTAAVVAGFGDRVCCIHKPNGGAPSARNVGIRAARGEYIAFVDADDLWVKEKLQLQMDLLKKTGLAWGYCDAFAFDDKSGKRLYRFEKNFHQYAGDILESLFFVDFIPSPTPVIRKSVFEHVGYFDEDRAERIGEDWDMWLRIAACYPIGLVSQPLAYYRVHTTSIMGGEDPLRRLRGELGVIKKAVAREPARLGSLYKGVTANYYINAGRAMAGQGNVAGAREMFAQAIHCQPGRGNAYVFWLSTLLGSKVLGKVIQLNRLLRRYFGQNVEMM
ncbi:glycosyltransferase [bacterium]|nr:MAG: glycosyltransferase [bacterium]